MGLSKRLLDLSTRDVEEALYPSEPWREFEDVYDEGIWPSPEELADDEEHQ